MFYMTICAICFKKYLELIDYIATTEIIYFITPHLQKSSLFGPPSSTASSPAKVTFTALSGV